MKLSECEAQVEEPPKEASQPVGEDDFITVPIERVVDVIETARDQLNSDHWFPIMKDRLSRCEAALACLNTAELIVGSGLVYIEFDSSRDIAEQILVAITPHPDEEDK